MYEKVEISNDGTIKLIYKNNYSAVLIPQSDKYSLCVSSQIGCAMGCKFCFTAKYKLERNLTSKEIIEQFEDAINYLNLENIASKNNSKSLNFASDKIKSIVFMGMGEPMNNFENVIKTCNFLNSFYFYPFKKITISTSGIIPKMKLFLENDYKMLLALSLHSPNQKIRNKIMSNLSMYSIKDLVKISNEYNLKNKTKIMVEYLMIKGLTDRDEDLKDLIKLGFFKKTYFNLIPLNSTMQLEDKTYNKSDLKTCEKFKEKLISQGYKCFIRESMGQDIEAACGMLKVNNN